MSGTDDLVRAYGKLVSLPWTMGQAPAQRTWMIVYAPPEERRVRRRVLDFENATTAAGKVWQLVDVTHSFAEWLDTQPYRVAYFKRPETLSSAVLQSFRRHLSTAVLERATQAANPDAVIAVLGVGALYPFLEVSVFADDIAQALQGRLVIFFPGEYKNNNYRLLDARDGWNYLATPITATEDAR